MQNRNIFTNFCKLLRYHCTNYSEKCILYEIVNVITDPFVQIIFTVIHVLWCLPRVLNMDLRVKLPIVGQFQLNIHTEKM